MNRHVSRRRGNGFATSGVALLLLLVLVLAACGGSSPNQAADCPVISNCYDSNQLGIGELSPRYSAAWTADGVELGLKLYKNADVWAEIHLGGGDGLAADVDGSTFALLNPDGRRWQWSASVATSAATPAMHFDFTRGGDRWRSTVTMPPRFSPVAASVSLARSQQYLTVAMAPPVAEALAVTFADGQCHLADGGTQDLTPYTGYTVPVGDGSTHRIAASDVQAGIDGQHVLGNAVATQCTMRLVYRRQRVGVLAAGLNGNGSVTASGEGAQSLAYDAVH